MGDVELWRRIIESSPVIVLLLVSGLVVLWRKLEAKDQAYTAITREVAQALVSNTAAVTSLRDAIERGERRDHRAAGHAD